MSNREIAAELFISVKTVETSLSSAYRKLGIRSEEPAVHQPDAVTSSQPFSTALT